LTCGKEKEKRGGKDQEMHWKGEKKALYSRTMKKKFRVKNPGVDIKREGEGRKSQIEIM